MTDRVAAHRYARALEAALEGDSELSRVADELAVVVRILEADPVVLEALTTPAMGLARRRELLDTMVSSAKLSARTALFLRILAEHGHMHLLPLIAERIASLRDRRMGIVEAEVVTAAPLAPEQAERTRLALERKTGKKVRLALRTDASIIGGMIARVGSTVYDGSVRTRLAALRSHIARG